MGLQLDEPLVGEYNVGEVVASMLQGKLQSLLFIHVTYELAVGRSSEGPPQRRPAAQDGPETQCIQGNLKSREAGLQWSHRPASFAVPPPSFRHS